MAAIGLNAMSLPGPPHWVSLKAITPNAANMAEKSETSLSFEEALGELEALVEKMEHEELTLEESLQSFERGVQLTRTCQEALKAAEQKVDILTSQAADARPEPFEPSN